MTEWISVEESLPEDGKCVIGSGWLFGDKEKGQWVEPAIYSSDDLAFHPVAIDSFGDLVADFDADMCHTTHWIKLPEPPK